MTTAKIVVHKILDDFFFYVKDTLFSFSQGQYVKMACSRLGSRVLEAVWNSSSVNHRQNIAQELGNANMTYTPSKQWSYFLLLLVT